MFGSSLSPVVYRRGLMSYILHMCLFTNSGVQHILCCVFVLFILILCVRCCRFLWIVHVWLPLRYSLPFKNRIIKTASTVDHKMLNLVLIKVLGGWNFLSNQWGFVLRTQGGLWFGLWWLTPLSTIFQLYRGGQF